METQLALHEAALENDFLSIRLLVKNGLSVDLQNSFGWTALMVAARKGCTEAARALLEVGADVHIENRLEMTALHFGCSSNSVETVQLLLEHGAVPEKCNKQILSPLMVAAMSGSVAITKLLLDKGIRSNQANSQMNLTPVMLAAAGRHQAVIDTLCERGARTSTSNRAGYTAAHVARILSSPLSPTMKFVNEAKSNIRRLEGSILEAIKVRDVARVRQLLLHDPSKARMCEEDGRTALMEACLTGDETIVELLVEQGANVNACDSVYGWTPLMQAIYHGHTRMALYLLQCGADPHSRAKGGDTAQDVAARQIDHTLMHYFHTRNTTGAGHEDALKITLKRQQIPPSRNYKQWWRRISHKVKKSSSSGEIFLENTITEADLLHTATPTSVPPPYDVLDLKKRASDMPKLFQSVVAGSLEDDSRYCSCDMTCDPGPPPPSTHNLHQWIQRKKSHAAKSGSQQLVNWTPHNRLPPAVELLLTSVERSPRRKDTKATDNGLFELMRSLRLGELSQLLEKEGLESFIGMFDEQEIDCRTFLLLTREDFQELGFVDGGNIKALVAAQQSIKRQLEVMAHHPPPRH